MTYFSEDVPRDAPKPMDLLGKPLKCLACGGGRFWTRTQRMETGGFVQPRARLDDPDVRLAICSACGFVHHFVED